MTPVALELRALVRPALGEEGAGDVELALVEALTNVFRHGYGPGGGAVRVEAQAGAGRATLRILDWGRPIPPEALAGAGPARFDFDPDDLDALPAGGMGLSLILLLMDHVAYRSDEGGNELTLVRGARP